MRTKDVNMLSGSITKALIAISAPVMIMNVIQSLFSIVDMTVLEAFDTDGVAVGAVGVCAMLITLIINLVFGITTGSNVVIAKHIGRGDSESCSRAVGTSILFSVVSGIALAVIGVLGAETFLGWTDCPPELLAGATLYFRLYFAGAPLLMMRYFSSSVLRSSGNTQTDMLISIVGAVAKVICSLLMVAVFRLGVTGVALATIISWAISAVWSLIVLLRERGYTKLHRKHLRFYGTELPEILRIGIPSSIQMCLYSAANVLITTAVNGFGAKAATGVSIANTYDGLIYVICNATSLAVLPYVSQNIGAGNIKRACQSVWKGVLLSAGIGAFFGALSGIFSGQLASIMSGDPEVIAFAQQKMIIISGTYFICGVNDIFVSALRGMGKSTYPTIVTLIFMCGLRVLWVYAIFPLLPHLTFLYLVWPLGWICSILCSLPVYFSAKRHLELTASHTVSAIE